MEPLRIERSIWIDAPCRRVWRAISDPNQIARWYSPGAAWQMTAFEVGGRLSMEGPQTGDVLYTEVIDVLEPPYRLCLRAEGDVPNAGLLTAYTLASVSGGTLMTVTYTLPEGTDHTGEECPGIYMVLENIRALCEETPLPHPEGVAFQYAW